MQKQHLRAHPQLQNKILSNRCGSEKNNMQKVADVECEPASEGYLKPLELLAELRELSIRSHSLIASFSERPAKCGCLCHQGDEADQLVAHLALLSELIVGLADDLGA